MLQSAIPHLLCQQREPIKIMIRSCVASHLLLATKWTYDGPITEASIISTGKQPRLRHKNFSSQMQINFSVGAESFVHHMQSNRRFMFSFSCKMWLIIKAFAFIAQRTFDKNTQQREAIYFWISEFCCLNYYWDQYDTTEKKKKNVAVSRKLRRSDGQLTIRMHTHFISFKIVILRAI